MKKIIWLSIVWVIVTLVNYYYLPFFILVFEWLFMVALFFILTILQITKLFIERKAIKKQRLYSLLIVAGIFLLTFYRNTTNTIIEKVDWSFFYNKRVRIVEQVKNGELKPNVENNGWVCELPFEFPVVSNGGNDIGIFKSKIDNSLTVEFWVFRNFFESPSTSFVYSENENVIERIEKRTVTRPNHNWKIKDNWYRVYGDY